jgi:Ca2+-binding RTX toxin-like protein
MSIKSTGLSGLNRVGFAVSERMGLFATIDGTDGDDSIIGTGDGDEINTGDGRDTVRGRDGDDTIFTGKNDDVIFGARGNDFIYGDNGDDWMQGNDGDDTLGGVNGDDTLDGGLGNDMAFYTHFDRSDREGEGVAIDLRIQGVAQDTGGMGMDVLINIENVLGSNVDDTITGNDGDNALYGNTGVDILTGLGGNDLLIAEAGTVVGGDGDDTLQAAGDLNGGEGNDLIVGLSGANNMAQGVGGNDYVQGGLQADTIIGGEGNDQLVGNGGDDGINGGAGDDLVNASIAFDLLGITGNGTYAGGDGVDDTGETGIDTLSFFDGYFVGGPGVKVNLSKHEAQNTGVGTIVQTGFENLVGSAGAFQSPGGNDTLIGTGGANSIMGTWGNDLIRGAQGNDFLYGDHHLLPGVYVGLPQGETFLGDGAINGTDVEGLYDDTLIGGQGNDTLWGSEGEDLLVGGKGNDVYMYALLADSTFDNPDDDDDAGYDIIRGFRITNDDGTMADMIDVSAIDAVTDVDGDDTTTGDQAFTYVRKFTGTAGEIALSYDKESNTSYLKFDVDGDSVSDMTIQFDNTDLRAITQDSFVA